MALIAPVLSCPPFESVVLPAKSMKAPDSPQTHHHRALALERPFLTAPITIAAMYLWRLGKVEQFVQICIGLYIGQPYLESG